MKDVKRRSGRVADTARLDFHAWDGTMIDRMKCKTTEKTKGVMMIEKIKERFGITPLDEQEIARENIEDEKSNLKTIFSDWSPEEKKEYLNRARF